MASMSRRLFLIRKTLRPGPARIEDATPAAGPGEHLNEFPKGNDSMQGQYCHSEEQSDEESVTLPKIDS